MNKLNSEFGKRVGQEVTKQVLAKEAAGKDAKSVTAETVLLALGENPKDAANKVCVSLAFKEGYCEGFKSAQRSGIVRVVAAAPVTDAEPVVTQEVAAA